MCASLVLYPAPEVLLTVHMWCTVCSTESGLCSSCCQACEGDRMAVAEILVAAFPDTLSVRDNRGRLPRDVVPNWSPPWAHTLGDRDTET
jgi:hypothetical protein